MPIETSAAPKLTGLRVAEFQTSAEWVVGLWGLRPTGKIRLDGTKILIEFVVLPGSGVEPGSVVTGNLMHAVLPTTLGPVPSADKA